MNTPAREAFARRWQAAWAVLGIDAPDTALRDALLARYAEPQRHYHTLQHLDECLALFEAHGSAAERPGEVALALWFHDAVYALQAHDNEQRSADWARDALRAAGIDEQAAQRVHALVMATRHDAPAEGRDAQLLVDIDLAILGAPPARFAEYEAQIRREYAHVPADQFALGRRAILERFLAREPLYRSAAMRAAREARAKANLRAALGR